MRWVIASLAVVMAALPIVAQEPAREPVQPSGWSSSGPPLPVVFALAAPSDVDSLVYAGVSRGYSPPSALFQSIDAGASWASLADAPAGETITGVAINRSHPLEMYAETSRVDATSVLYRSSDRGVSWIHAFDAGVACGRIVFDQTGSSVFIACGDRILRSDDSGVTWIQVPAPGTDVYGLAPSSDGSIFAFDSARIFRTADAGATWAVVGTAPGPCPSIVTLAVAPDAPETLFVGTVETTYIHLVCGGVFRSLDGGASWTSVGLGLDISQILIDPRDPSRVFASADNCGFFCPSGGVFMSADRGETWTDLRFPGIAVGGIALSSQSRTLYAAATGGVFQYRFRRPMKLPPR